MIGSHTVFCAERLDTHIDRDLFNLNLWWGSADFPTQVRLLAANNIPADYYSAAAQTQNIPTQASDRISSQNTAVHPTTGIPQCQIVVVNNPDTVANSQDRDQEQDKGKKEIGHYTSL